MKKYTTLIISFIIIAGVFFLINSSFAGVITESVSGFGQQVYGGDPRPPQEVAALIIQVIIGLMGMVFFTLLIYGGYMYMTAGGKEERIKKAKDTIIAAVIGLLIVLAAYAIATFVINAILEGTGGGASGGGAGGNGGAAAD
ncbi:hypothetical protein ACFL2U_00305 [Patescibacteria group bacterium]